MGVRVVIDRGNAGSSDAAASVLFALASDGTESAEFGSISAGKDAVAEEAAADGASGVWAVAVAPFADSMGTSVGCALGRAADTSKAVVVISAVGVNTRAASVEAATVSTEAVTDMSKANFPVSSPDCERATDARGSCASMQILPALCNDEMNNTV